MRIILACAAGMSTSLLARNIQAAAQERGVDISVEAMSTSSLDETQWRNTDVVLLGPQMRHLLDDLSSTGEQYHVPVAAIPPGDYAMANGQNVLEQAITLVENQEFRKDSGSTVKLPKRHT